MRHLIAVLASLALTVFVLSGCAPKVSYVDPDAVETVNIDFGRTDLQTIVNRMTSSLLESVVIAEGQRPVVYFHQVRNKTDEHIDTKSITDSIKVALVRSGKYRVTGAMEVSEEIRNQVQYQTGSGMVDPNTAVRVGRQIGAQYFLYGDFDNIRKQGGRLEDNFFKFTLQMINVETGLLEWADEKQIAKQQRRALIGR